MASPSDVWKGFAAGSAAAMVSGAVTHPIDLLKVRMQLAGACTTPLTTHVRSSGPAPTLVRTAAALVQKEGMTALYRGLSASLLRQATFIGTKFGSYDILKGYCQQCSTSNAQYANASAVSNAAAGGAGISFVAKTVCGFGAGALGAAVGNPADLAMVRMQADGRLPLEHRRNYRHVGDALVRIIRQEGVGTLWRGCSPTVQRAMIITASQLAVYDQVKEELVARGAFEEGPSLHVTSSIIASGVASVTSNPVDLLKTRLMNMRIDPSSGKLPYTGMLDCAVQTVRNEGVLALWKGLGPTLARQAPLNVVRFMCVEQFKKLFDSMKSPEPLAAPAVAPTKGMFSH
mmetsp:Transcript_16018/g.30768  ORF Transcript_16018/g.30768 Transcript_16018/m.30768 type:complete len:345 (+) Transcript_16018:568-1602(+)|eukprot:CAMPEP_0114244712 /NCGR_PEP_ID=MMETSP0058-20121206/11493_1 /TAXON_ID=36894 /ORGANISM="Pyramimonas parkeae, CCMP726" /LENGTH=344 /DNA_ID=CAMNT_0001357685 /DNA_START=539 /DNA_END=1573 /DNA_ORIENTATION=-